MVMCCIDKTIADLFFFFFSASGGEDTGLAECAAADSSGRELSTPCNYLLSLCNVHYTLFSQKTVVIGSIICFRLASPGVCQ